MSTFTITIRTDVPAPENPLHYGFALTARRILRELPVGASFDIDKYTHRETVLRVAKEERIGVTTQKIDGGGYRIWRTPEFKQRGRGHPKVRA